MSRQECERLHEEVQLLLLSELQRGDQRRREEERMEALLAHTHTQLELLRGNTHTHTHTHTHSDSPLDLNHLNPNFLDQVWKSTLGFCWLLIIHRHMEVDVTGKIITTTNHSSPSFTTCVMSSGRSS